MRMITTCCHGAHPGWYLLPLSLVRVSLPPIGRLDSPCCIEITPFLAVVWQDFADATARAGSKGALKYSSRVEYYPSTAAVYASLQQLKIFQFRIRPALIES
eukprot:6188038-Pleurochrysis_carterae.AAC.1